MANRIQVRTSFAPSSRKAISLAALLMLGACETTDKIVDTVNPTNWFSSESEQTAQSAPPPADPNAAYPRIGPIEPAPPKPAIADEAAELRSSLIADKNNARYTDQVLRAQTEPAMREQQAAALSAAPPSPASIPQASPRTQSAASGSTAAAITPPPARPAAAASATAPTPVPVPVPVPTAVATAATSGSAGAAAAPVPVPVPAPVATQTAASATPAAAPTPARAAAPAPAPEPLPARPSPAPAPAPAPTPAANQTAALDRPSPPPQAASISNPPAAVAAAPVPAPAPAPAQPKAQAAQAQPKLIAHIFFGDGGATLSDADRDVLRQVAAIYRQSGGKGVVLVGHSSGRNGTKDALQGNLVNFKLSLDRATSVGSILVGFGLPRDVVKIDARGASEPKYDESTQNGEAGNRRVDVFIEY